MADNQEFMYMVHISGADNGSRIEAMLNRENVTGNIGNPNSALFPSIPKDRDRSHVIPQYEKETEEFATYFFQIESTDMDDHLSELKESVDLLLIQATSEEGEQRIQNGERRPGDAYGDDKVTAMILKVPVDKYESLITLGMGYEAEGTYISENGEKTNVTECCFSDRGLKKLSKYVMVYGNIATVLNDKELWGENAGYDARYNRALPNYTLSYTKLPTKSANTTNSYKDTKKELYAWYEKKEKDGVSPEDLALLKSAMNDALNYYNSPEDPKDLGEYDDEMEDE